MPWCRKEPPAVGKKVKDVSVIGDGTLHYGNVEGEITLELSDGVFNVEWKNGMSERWEWPRYSHRQMNIGVWVDEDE